MQTCYVGERNRTDISRHLVSTARNLTQGKSLFHIEDLLTDSDIQHGTHTLRVVKKCYLFFITLPPIVIVLFFCKEFHFLTTVKLIAFVLSTEMLQLATN